MRAYGLAARVGRPVIGPGDTIALPALAKRVGWEVELAAITGHGGRDIQLARAHEHIAGHTVFHDVGALTNPVVAAPLCDISAVLAPNAGSKA